MEEKHLLSAKDLCSREEKEAVSLPSTKETDSQLVPAPAFSSYQGRKNMLLFKSVLNMLLPFSKRKKVTIS